jgi:hypothetical protein
VEVAVVVVEVLVEELVVVEPAVKVEQVEKGVAV